MVQWLELGVRLAKIPSTTIARLPVAFGSHPAARVCSASKSGLVIYGLGFRAFFGVWDVRIRSFGWRASCVRQDLWGLRFRV